MKKKLTYLILVISTLSCSKTPVLPDAVPAAISFVAPEVVEVKSVLIEDKSDLVSGDGELGYSVFAARYTPKSDGTVGYDHEQFMDDVKIYSSDGGFTWKYDEDTFYWSPGAVHKFFAVYPYYHETDDTYDYGISYAINEEVHALQVTGKHVEDSKTYICTGTDTDGKNVCPDILYGVEMYSDPYNVGEDRKPISFRFNHALTAVSFRFRNASELPIKSITTESVSGFKNASEYVRLSGDGAVWAKNPVNVTEHSFNVPQFNASEPMTSDRIASGAYFKTTGDYWYTALMIPQDFGQGDSPVFRFTVKFDSATASDKTYVIRFQDYPVHNTAEHAFTFLPGCHYEYNINVTSKYISCDVKIVDWIEDEPIKLN
jgi:hypothetical protein